MNTTTGADPGISGPWDNTRGGSQAAGASGPPALVERGSALILAILIVVIMSLMGLAFALVAETENKISVNERHQGQALYVAEGAVRCVKSWFDDPGATGFVVPTTSQVNRSLRFVDDDSDGTYVAYASAPTGPPAWNVLYKQDTGLLFDKPYRGVPMESFEGTQSNPDLRISALGSAGEKAYLTTLNNTLFPNFPNGHQRALVTQIDVYSPPLLYVAGSRVRYGIATVLVTVGMFDNAGTAAPVQVGERVVKATINEVPYTGAGPQGPLQSCVNIDVNGNFGVHWGTVTSAGDSILDNNIDQKIHSSIPYQDRENFISADNWDGTADDVDTDGTVDYETWLTDTTQIEDPWLRFWSEGDITKQNGSHIDTDCTGANCQPSPFVTPTRAPYAGTDDHSNMTKNVSITTCPNYDYDIWKSIAQSGGKGIRYFPWLNGVQFRDVDGVARTFRQITEKYPTGLSFFDTVDSIAPHDDDGDGLADNLTPAIKIAGGGYQAGGFIYLNATTFETTGSGSAPAATIIAPGEPFRDENNNGVCDADPVTGEWFFDLDYPAAYDGTFGKNGWHQNGVGGYSRAQPDPAAGPTGVWNNADINVEGVFYTNGGFDCKGNYIFFGAVITHEGMTSTTGTAEIYFDERLTRNLWPPANLALPRTYISNWETDL